MDKYDSKIIWDGIYPGGFGNHCSAYALTLLNFEHTVEEMILKSTDDKSLWDEKFYDWFKWYECISLDGKTLKNIVVNP